MPPPDATAEDPPGKVQFRGQTVSSDKVAEPDTEVVVTDEVVAVHPMATADPANPIEFTISTDEIGLMECDGFMCRTITLETETDSYEIPTRGLNEGNFREAVAETANLANTCMRLNLDRLGVCPCSAGTYAGCVLCVIGFALVLSVVGALLGAGLLAVGIGLLIVAYAARKCGKWRGANVWEREANGPDATV